MNCILSYPDFTTPSLVRIPTFSGGSWLETLPLANLLLTTFSTKVRTADTASESTQFLCNLGTPRPIRVLSILGHNGTADATIRIRIGTDAGFAYPEYDSGPVPLRAEGIDIETQMFWARQFLLPLPASVVGQYVKVEVVDESNPDGFFELIHCFIGPGWEPPINLSYGAGITWEDDTTSERSLGGVDHYDEKTLRRVMQFTLDALTPDEALDHPFEIQRLAGTSKPLYFVFDGADNGLKLLKRSFLCTLRRLSPLEFPYFNNTSVGFELQEINAVISGYSDYVINGGTAYPSVLQRTISGGGA